MGSLWKHPKSQFWFACFTDANSKRRKVSTKSTNRKEALRIAWEFEEAYRRRRTTDQVEKVIRRAHEELTGEKSVAISLAEFVTAWNASKKAEGASASSLRVYGL